MIFPAAETAKPRVAVVVSGPSSKGICRTLVRKYAAVGNYEVSLIILEQGATKPCKLLAPESISRIFQKSRTCVFNLTLWLEKYMAFKVKIVRDFTTPKLSNLGIPIRTIQSTLTESSAEENTSKIRELLGSFKIDKIVHLCPAIASPSLSKMSNIDEVHFRGGGSSPVESIEALCFHSVHERRSTVEAEVVLHQKFVNRTSVIGRISVPAKWLTSVTLQAFEAKASYMAHVAIEGSNKKLGSPSTLRWDAEITAPPAIDAIRQLQVTMVSLFHRLLALIVRSDPRWHVAYNTNGPGTSFVEEDMLCIPNPKDRFFADPFLIAENGKTFCFVEDYSVRSKKGRISVLELGSAGHRLLGPALKEEFHLSFPFIFRDGDVIYMCPESAGAGQIRLYRALDFPLSWTLDTVLMDKVSAVDTLVFRRNNKWWMLTNLSPEGGPNHQSELHLFSANKLRTHHWHPHPLNPVISDAITARNAGIIIAGNEIFRAYQRFSFDNYGSGIGISRIKKLNEDEYSEELVEEINPRKKEIKGLHTISVDHQVVATDFFFKSKSKSASIQWSQVFDISE